MAGRIERAECETVLAFAAQLRKSGADVFPADRRQGQISIFGTGTRLVPRPKIEI